MKTYLQHAAHSSGPAITIVIRAKNEERMIGRTLDMVFRQQMDLRFEVLVIDSGSTDRTVEIARQYEEVRVESIPSECFNFGATLNRGAQLARGRFIVALSAHCVPADTNWLRNLVDPVRRDPLVAGSFGRQTPWPDCEPVEHDCMTATFGPSDRMTSGQDVGTDILGPLFSNANSCFRRDLVLEIPFRSLPSCEDRVWAHDVLRQGYKLAYQARACVHHSHNRGLRDYYYFGKKKGRTRIVLGVEPFCLADCGWFGVKRAWWSLEHWFRKGRAQGRPVVAAARFALAAVSRIIVMNIGVLQGQRGSLQVPAPGGRPSGLAPTGALPEGALPEATPSLPHSASHASC